MQKGISVIINTFNEEDIIGRAIDSVKWADEIIICDMHSKDKTVEIAKRAGAKVFYHNFKSFVEPARNFAISKASKEWILILDPDEEVSLELKDKLLQISQNLKQIDYIRVPRKNLIFGMWVRASMWWPDYNIRFFKKDKVSWSDRIHRPPSVLGQGLDLPEEEKWAIIHHHYNNVSQYLERMIRYTKIQAEELEKNGYKFEWGDLIKKPLGEFLGRFFANKGYQDGIHGLALSLLQAFSQLVVYLRLWEVDGFRSKELSLKELNALSEQAGKDIDYWFKYCNLSKNPFKRFVQKVRSKI